MADEGKQATVEAYFAAISSQDVEALTAVFSPDGVMEDPVGTRPIQGRDGFQRFLDGITSTFNEMILTPAESFHAGGEVAVRWTAQGRSKEGVEVHYGGIDVFSFDEEGRVTRMRGYWEPRALFAQLKGA